MAKCEICNKGVSFGIKVSHSHRRSNKMWKPNVRRVRAIVNGEHKRMYVCTRCLRSGLVERGHGCGLAKEVAVDIDMPVVNTFGVEDNTVEAIETVVTTDNISADTTTEE